MDRFYLCNLPVSHCRSIADLLTAMHEAHQANRAFTASFVNPQAWSVVKRYPDYRDQLNALDAVLADGIGVVKASRWLGYKIVRLSLDATSLYEPLMRDCVARAVKLYIIGAAPNAPGSGQPVAALAAARMQTDFPGLRVAGYRHGHLADQTAEADAIKAILASEADLVICGMGVPRQEAFMLALKEAGFRGAVFSCGGFLDQLIAGERYYPAWVDRFDLRWLYRLTMEPRRLGRRYLLEYWPFIGAILLELISRQLFNRQPGPVLLKSDDPTLR